MEEDKYFKDVSQDEVYKSIDDEIKKAKKDHPVSAKIQSEKKGIVLPIVINIAIIVVVTLGLMYYLLTAHGKVKEESLSSSVAGVEEDVIRELQRRSEEQIELQRRKLNDAIKRLEDVKRERDFFLQNQTIKM